MISQELYHEFIRLIDAFADEHDLTVNQEIELFKHALKDLHEVKAEDKSNAKVNEVA